MAAQAQRSCESTASPRSVLERIGSRPVVFRPDSAPPEFETVDLSLKVFDPAVADDDVQPDHSSEAAQAKQLGQHLVRWQAELQRQQDCLEHEKTHWHRQAGLAHERQLEQQKSFEQREQQIRSLEYQLLQLQNDVIDGQMAMRAVADQMLAAEATAAGTPERADAMTLLRFELNQRFDYLIKRWDALRSNLDSLHATKSA